MDRQAIIDAIGRILRFCCAEPREVPDSVTDPDGILEYMLLPSGVMRRHVTLEKGWYRDAAGPMLGFRTDDGTPIALLPSGTGGYRFEDPASGKTIRLYRKTEGLISREAFVFYAPFPRRPMTAGDLARYLLRQVSAADLALPVLCALMVTLAGMLTPWLSNLLFSDVLASGSVRMLLGIAVFMACAAVSRLLFDSVRSLLSARVGTKLNLAAEAATVMRVMSLPASFTGAYSAGELSSRCGCVSAVCGRITNIALSAGLSSLFSLLYISQILLYAPSLLLPSLAVTALTLLVTLARVVMQIRLSRRKLPLAARESGMSYQLIAGIRKIRLSGAEDRAFEKWKEAYGEVAELTWNPPLFLKLAPVITLAVSLAGTLAVYVSAVRGGVTVAEFYAFNAAYGMVSGAFIALAGIAAAVAGIRPSLEMARPILEACPESAEGRQPVTSLSGSVALKDVSFRYREDGPAVLDRLSMEILPGQVVAVVGKTGCGKSTLMRILLGLEQPREGSVLYDGQDLNTLDLRSLRRRIGSVTQGDRLLMDTVFANIAVCTPGLTREDAWDALETAGLAEDIRRMPLGLNTLVSEGGGGLSGGQRQRLLIARAVASKPKILMLDEAVSALDNVTRAQVSAALRRLGCTLIVFAHQFSDVSGCDKVYMLEEGHLRTADSKTAPAPAGSSPRKP